MKNSRGFTLIELMIVVALVGILAAISILSYNSFMDKARITSATAALHAVRSELETYNIDKGKYPLSITSWPNFTDENNDPILRSLNLELVRQKIYNWDTEATYVQAGDSYTMTAKALDKDHTLLTVTPLGVTK